MIFDIASISRENIIIDKDQGLWAFASHIQHHELIYQINTGDLLYIHNTDRYAKTKNKKLHFLAEALGPPEFGSVCKDIPWKGIWYDRLRIKSVAFNHEGISTWKTLYDALGERELWYNSTGKNFLPIQTLIKHHLHEDTDEERGAIIPVRLSEAQLRQTLTQRLTANG
jgi:hypothetical protein